jgi:hypothetical protein
MRKNQYVCTINSDIQVLCTWGEKGRRGAYVSLVDVFFLQFIFKNRKVLDTNAFQYTLLMINTQNNIYIYTMYIRKA